MGSATRLPNAACFDNPCLSGLNFAARRLFIAHAGGWRHFLDERGDMTRMLQCAATSDLLNQDIKNRNQTRGWRKGIIFNLPPQLLLTLSSPHPTSSLQLEHKKGMIYYKVIFSSIPSHLSPPPPTRSTPLPILSLTRPRKATSTTKNKAHTHSHQHQHQLHSPHSFCLFNSILSACK
jgi:hypothetical protein